MSFVSIGKGFLLEAITARQFMLWNWAFFQRFRVDMVVNWTKRSEAEQIALLHKYYTRLTSRPTRGAKGYWWDGYWWQQRGKTIVAKPNTSRHQLGYAGDVESFRWSYNREMAQWARDTASLYGFAFNVTGEDWHVDRVLPMRITSGKQRPLGAGTASAPEQQSGNGPLPSTSAPAIPIPVGDEDMLIIHNKDMSGKFPGMVLVKDGPRVQHVARDTDAEFLTKHPEHVGIYFAYDNVDHFTTLLAYLGVPAASIPDATKGRPVFWVDNPRD